MGRSEAERLAMLAASAERALVVNVISARNLPWRPSEKPTRVARGECCPFVEVALLDSVTKQVFDPLRFQTRRLRLRAAPPQQSRVDGAVAVAPRASLNTQLPESEGGAVADFRETFSWRPRGKDFWEVSQPQCHHFKTNIFFRGF